MEEDHNGSWSNIRAVDVRGDRLNRHGDTPTNGRPSLPGSGRLLDHSPRSPVQDVPRYGARCHSVCRGGAARSRTDSEQHGLPSISRPPTFHGTLVSAVPSIHPKRILVRIFLSRLARPPLRRELRQSRQQARQVPLGPGASARPAFPQIPSLPFLLALAVSPHELPILAMWWESLYSVFGEVTQYD